MKNSAALFVRIVRADGSRPYAKPVICPNNHLRPLYAFVDETAEYHAEGVYYLRYTAHERRTWRKIGSSAAEAKTALELRNHALKDLVMGIASPDLAPVPVLPNNRSITKPARLTWKQAVREYMISIEGRKRSRTATAYRAALEAFEAFKQVEFIDEITKSELQAFEMWVRKGHAHRTAYNRVTQIQTFLRTLGLNLLAKCDYLGYTKSKPNAYGPHEIRLLLSAAEPEDRLIFEAFLGSGLREQEMMFLALHGLDETRNLLMVREKLDVGFYIKDHEERDIPIPDSLVRKLVAHRAAHPGQRWMFVSRRGNPDGHLLRCVKRVALQAGLNCGRCLTRKGLCCGENPTCEKWDLHKFRRTFATRHHESGVSARTLMDWLGHSDIETVLLYLAAADVSFQKTRVAVSKTFEALAS